MKLDVDHYLVLGVPRTTDAAMIRAAYVALAKRYHPDVASGNPELAAFNFRQITNAYHTLSEPDARGRYDARVQAGLAAERTRRELAAQAAAAARAARSAPKTRMADKLFGGAGPKAAAKVTVQLLARLPSRPALPPRPAPLPAHLPHADAMARRRSSLVVAVVLLSFIGVGGYLATRAVKGPGLQVMAAETPRSLEARHPPVETQGRPKPKPVPPVNQPSQPGPSGLPPGAPMSGAMTIGPTMPRPVPVTITDGQSVCIADDGAKFAIINRGGEPTVIYNGAPPMRASVQFSDRFLVVLTGVVPSDTIMIGIQRGQDNGTQVYYADSNGAIVQTVAARCEGQAY